MNNEIQKPVIQTHFFLQKNILKFGDKITLEKRLLERK